MIADLFNDLGHAFLGLVISISSVFLVIVINKNGANTPLYKLLFTWFLLWLLLITGGFFAMDMFNTAPRNIVFWLVLIAGGMIVLGQFLYTEDIQKFDFERVDENAELLGTFDQGLEKLVDFLVEKTPYSLINWLMEGDSNFKLIFRVLLSLPLMISFFQLAMLIHYSFSLLAEGLNFYQTYSFDLFFSLKKEYTANVPTSFVLGFVAMPALFLGLGMLNAEEDESEVDRFTVFILSVLFAVLIYRYFLF